MKLFRDLFFVLFVLVSTISWGQPLNGDFKSVGTSATTWMANATWLIWNSGTSTWDPAPLSVWPGAVGYTTQNVEVSSGDSLITTGLAGSTICGPITVNGTLTLTLSNMSCSSLTVAGTVYIGTTALSNKAFNITNDFTVTSTGRVFPVAGQSSSGGNKHTFNIGGNLLNNGNIVANATYITTGKTTKTAFNFKKAGTATISTTGTPILTAFGNLGVNSATTLDILTPITIGGTTVAVVADSGQIITSNGSTVTYLTMAAPALSYSGSSFQTTGPEASTAPSININNINGVKLGSNAVLGGSLTFSNGKLSLGSYNLIVGGSITGGSSSKYVITDGTGYLKLNVTNTGTDVYIPIGYTDSYTPVVLNNALTGTSDYFTLKVKNAFDITPNTSKLVKKQWTITESGTGADVKVTLQWNTGDEDVSFIRTNPLYLRKNAGSSWVSTSATYADSGSGIYSASATGLKEFGTFLVTNDPPQTMTLKALIEGFFDGSNLVSDTVIVELHTASSPYTLVESERMVLNTSGNATGIFCNEVNGTPYYITVKHRNAVETWSASAQSFTASTLNYDFTTSQDQAFGSNLVNKGSKWCLYSGDVNQDGAVDIFDLSPVDNDAASFGGGYVPTDINGDGSVDIFDLSVVDNNTSLFIGKIVPTSVSPSRNIKKQMININ